MPVQTGGLYSGSLIPNSNALAEPANATYGASGGASGSWDLNPGVPEWSPGITVLQGAVSPGPSAQEVQAQQAAQAEQARQDGLRSNFNTQKQGIFDSINQWGDNTAARYGLDVQDFGNKFRQGQDALNRRGADLEAKKMQATSGILGMIGRGVKSAGNYLGGRNAGSSSASGEIAKAYGDIGRRNMSSVGNEYSAGQEQLGVDQNIFNTDAESSLNRFKLNMDEQINGQVESARAALTDLDVQMQNASLPDRIAITLKSNIGVPINK